MKCEIIYKESYASNVLFKYIYSPYFDDAGVSEKPT
jgi:hypothetical protein